MEAEQQVNELVQPAPELKFKATRLKNLELWEKVSKLLEENEEIIEDVDICLILAPLPTPPEFDELRQTPEWDIDVDYSAYKSSMCDEELSEDQWKKDLKMNLKLLDLVEKLQDKNERLKRLFEECSRLMNIMMIRYESNDNIRRLGLTIDDIMNTIEGYKQN